MKFKQICLKLSEKMWPNKFMKQFAKHRKIAYQIAQNRVKVATDANIFEDRTFFEVPLKNFLLTS